MYCIILVTSDNLEEAKMISQKLLKDKLVACINIIEDVKSLFWWQGKINNGNEVLLLLKTNRIFVKKIIKKIKIIHSYDCPEIVVLPIIEGNKDYLRWIDNSIQDKR